MTVGLVVEGTPLLHAPKTHPATHGRPFAKERTFSRACCEAKCLGSEGFSLLGEPRNKPGVPYFPLNPGCLIGIPKNGLIVGLLYSPHNWVV